MSRKKNEAPASQHDFITDKIATKIANGFLALPAEDFLNAIPVKAFQTRTRKRTLFNLVGMGEEAHRLLVQVIWEQVMPEEWIDQRRALAKCGNEFFDSYESCLYRWQSFRDAMQESHREWEDGFEDAMADFGKALLQFREPLSDATIGLDFIHELAQLDNDTLGSLRKDHAGAVFYITVKAMLISIAEKYGIRLFTRGTGRFTTPILDYMVQDSLYCYFGAGTSTQNLQLRKKSIINAADKLLRRICSNNINKRDKHFRWIIIQNMESYPNLFEMLMENERAPDIELLHEIAIRYGLLHELGFIASNDNSGKSDYLLKINSDSLESKAGVVPQSSMAIEDMIDVVRKRLDSKIS